MRKSKKGRRRQAASSGQRPADPRLQRAVRAMNGKNFPLASSILEQILQDTPNDADAHNLLGVAAMEMGHAALAVEHLEKATKADPKNAFYAFNLGHAHLRAKSLDAAAVALKKSVKLKPDLAAAHALRGDALRGLGRPGDARDAYEKAISLQDNLAQAHHGLGLVLLQSADQEGAARHFRLALSRLPPGAGGVRATIHANLGITLDQLGQQPEAVEHLLDAVDMAPDNAPFRQALVGALRNIKSIPQSPKLKPTLLMLLEAQDVNPRSLSTAVQACFRELDGVGDLMSHLSRDPEISLTELGPCASALRALLSDSLFLGFLSNAPVTDVDLEILVTLVRRALLLAFVDEGSAADDWVGSWTDERLSLTAVLACQGWLNEYVAYVTPSEQEALEQIGSCLSAPADDLGDQAWEIMALLACYKPIHDQGYEMPASKPPPELEDVVQQQVGDVLEEEAIKAELATLKPMQDEVSLAVQDQYEQNPYPRWTRSDLREPMSLAEAVASDLPYIDASECPKTDQPRVLIAGCGTGLQTMKAASHYRGASIRAIDLSRSSLAYGIRKLREYDVVNVEHLHADILDLDHMDEHFDLVESYGVIHHMNDTEQALRILSNRLKTGGIMYLGLYSEIGRQSIVQVRDLIAQRQYAQSDAGIRQARRDIMRELDPALTPVLSPASDFWTMSDTRDLIFHVHEHRFTLLEIGSMIRACGLGFLGLALRNPVDRLAFAREFPQQDAARNIENWHAFEQRHPETFGDTYKLWLKKL